MNQDQILGAVRQSILAASAGLLVKHGFSAPQAQQIGEAALAIGMYVWSWWEKREAATLAKADRINAKAAGVPISPPPAAS
jgi:hypothetical protein